jgi:outer membrane lipoprotein SlyB
MDTFKTIICATAATALLAGCASAPPNTPGAGVGKGYTPVIDLQGVNGERYMGDLTACRDYSASIDANKEALLGMIGGAILGAAIGASVGNGNLRTIDAGATAGAAGGLGGASGRALGRQERIIGNCMAARGYRVLDGTAQVSYEQMAAPVTAPTFAPHSGLPSQPPTLPAPTLVPGPTITAPAKPELGEDAYIALKLARAGRCASGDAKLTMAAKGPGFETYSAPCANGDTVMIRCEFGNCRELR